MTGFDSIPAQRFDNLVFTSPPMAGGQFSRKSRLWSEWRLWVRESLPARVVLAIVVSLLVLAAVKLGVLDAVGDGSFLRNVSGWVGPAAAAGAAGAAAAAAAAGDPGAGVGAAGVPAARAAADAAFSDKWARRLASMSDSERERLRQDLDDAP